MKFKPSFILYFVAGILFTAFWLIIVFPYGALQDRVITEIETSTGGRYKLQMKDMSFSIFGTVTMKKVKLFEKKGGETNLLIQSPELKLRVSPFALMSKKIDFDFELKGNKKGGVEGDYTQNKGQIKLSADFDNYPISDLKLLQTKTGLNLKGYIDGKVRFVLDQARPRSNEGEMDLNLVQIQMAPLRRGGVNLPAIALTGKKGSYLKGTMKNNQLNLESKLGRENGDVRLDWNGRVDRLNAKTIQAMRLNIEGKLKLSDRILSAMAPVLAKRMRTSEKLVLQTVKDLQQADGTYPIKLQGRVVNLKLNFAGFEMNI